ncbi:paraneoplastic antigen Ma2-like [Puntigrus tetrazona]|uniref:paraneoplastic antigen Ma2-like n=1 Tax=Puntigrus tetrazona TaxID=1606681 RepID=UPI001C895524|nr:paraneoplastic antigen Ma2-like [Puntigrus tetrazona]
MSSKEKQTLFERRSWCETEKIDPQHAIILSGVPSDADVAFIEDTVQAIKIFGRVRARATKTGLTPETLQVLCECREKICPTKVPSEVLSSSGDAWKILIVADDEPDGDVFWEKLTQFLSNEGKTMSDLQGLVTGTTSPEAIIRAIGELLEKTSKPVSDGQAYRRLMIFSGVLPTPAGEESSENWLEQARLMVTECDCSAKVKRKRIVKSLKGSALEVVKAVRGDNPDATALEYLEALENAFSTSESGEDLYFAFRLLRQEPGEALSDFLRRIERSLALVVKRGGVTPQKADRAHIEQLLRGAVESDMMMLKLRLRERREIPPTFLKLLNEIREEEETEAARGKLTINVREPKLKDRTRGSLVSREGSKIEVKELRLQVGDHKQPPERVVEKEIRSTPPLTSEVQALKAQVQQLQKQLSALSVRPHVWEGEQSPRVSGIPIASGRSTTKSSDGFFCYHCGEGGHIAPKCRGSENSTLVIQKLLQLIRKSKDINPASNPKPPDVEKSECFSKTSHIESLEPGRLPKGLVGPSSTFDVKVNGHPCVALLDSGS